MGSKNWKQVVLNSFCTIGKMKECSSNATSEVEENDSPYNNTFLFGSFFHVVTLNWKLQSLWVILSIKLPQQGLLSLVWGCSWTGVYLWHLDVAVVENRLGWRDLLVRAGEQRDRVCDRGLWSSTLIFHHRFVLLEQMEKLECWKTASFSPWTLLGFLVDMCLSQMMLSMWLQCRALSPSISGGQSEWPQYKYRRD